MAVIKWEHLLVTCKTLNYTMLHSSARSEKLLYATTVPDAAGRTAAVVADRAAARSKDPSGCLYTMSPA